MTVYSYARVSTVEQASEDRSSLSTQTEICAAAAIIAKLAKPIPFIDPGVSGSTRLADRPEGGKMVANLKAGDVVIAAKLDRLFRSAADALNNVEKMKEDGIKLILVDIGIGPVTESAVAKMFLGILASVAEFEKNRILDRMAAGRAGKKKIGGHVGGDAPYGYEKVGIGKRAMLVNNRYELNIISIAKRLSETGVSQRAIAKRLDHMGLRTRSGKPWTNVQVARIIKRVQHSPRHVSPVQNTAELTVDQCSDMG